MLICNLAIPLSAYNPNSDTNYSKWPFLWIVLNFYQAAHISLIQNESYQQGPEKNESGLNKVLRKWKIMMNTTGTIKTLKSSFTNAMDLYT